ncbi:winged helix-turn-helix transcriptional regulator [Nakamurella sp. YIM 132087]|uniref:Winged helix-turn-helix transcriptional regulator n=1 Tax=Nakamurella alba TaxID=2665158 RepID=A0A7K1FLT7_9ACTN|nr:Lrp/AsnC family transcriptional regulator [Nakamurella alba]MTD15111.1 winged helix-turn-helix transcriptional regulator [Nakamurella alba]
MSARREPAKRAVPKAAARGSMAGLAGAIERQGPPVPLDDIDRELIRRLAADPRSSQRQLAREVNMSGPAVGERIARLERLGVIRGYTVDVDWAALGFPVLVYIPMSIAPGADLTQILADLHEIPELEELIAVTGTYDLMARFRLRDHAHLQTVLLEQLWPIYGLQRIETFLSLGEVRGASVLDRLLEPDVQEEPVDEG